MGKCLSRTIVVLLFILPVVTSCTTQPTKDPDEVMREIAAKELNEKQQ